MFLTMHLCFETVSCSPDWPCSCVSEDDLELSCFSRLYLPKAEVTGLCVLATLLIWYWGLNSGLLACWANTLLSYIPTPLLIISRGGAGEQVHLYLESAPMLPVHFLPFEGDSSQGYRGLGSCWRSKKAGVVLLFLRRLNKHPIALNLAPTVGNGDSTQAQFCEPINVFDFPIGT